MADEAQKKSNDDWLKALSLLALLSKEVPAGREQSAVIAAFVIVGLSIYSRAIFQLLYFLATGFLIWAAAASGDSLLIGYAVLYAVLGVVLLAEGERRRVGKGHFLSAMWWAGQALIHGLDIRHAYASGGASGFFTDLFFVIGGVMALKEAFAGTRDLWKVRYAWFKSRRSPNC